MSDRRAQIEQVVTKFLDMVKGVEGIIEIALFGSAATHKAVTEARLDDFIRNAQTREILPPQAADAATQRWIRANFPVNSIRCEQDGRAIPCPVCWHEWFLRGWAVPDHTLALCYNCGAVFFCDNGQVLQEFTGNRMEWGTMGIAFAAMLHERLRGTRRRTGKED